jgi:hypothetical protein
MKHITSIINYKLLIMPFLLFLVLFAGCRSIRRSFSPPENNYVIASSTMSEYSADQPKPNESFKPFYIYTDDKSDLNHFAPSGWMGDVSDLSLSGAYQDNPKMGNSCLKIAYLAKGSEGWAGIYWQNPANNWGKRKGGFDLRGATALTFWAKGEKGGEKITEFKIGGITGKFPDSDVAFIKSIKLTKEWRQYFIDLSKKDLRYINGGFCFVVLRRENPLGAQFYLDEIRYE